VGREVIPGKAERVNARLFLGQSNQKVAVERDRIGPREFAVFDRGVPGFL
jgi:hypothetical protein